MEGHKKWILVGVWLVWAVTSASYAYFTRSCSDPVPPPLSNDDMNKIRQVPFEIISWFLAHPVGADIWERQYRSACPRKETPPNPKDESGRGPCYSGVWECSKSP
jgi:hypothetical protein